MTRTVAEIKRETSLAHQCCSIFCSYALKVMYVKSTMGPVHQIYF